MSLALYMDEHVKSAVTASLRQRGIDVLTVQEDGFAERDDDEILSRATELERVLFTQDDDFLVIAHTWQTSGRQFSGVVSFNGKTFDLPLLSSRFILNRYDSILEDLPHLDLLHPARRLWKDRLSSCTLQNLEKEILNFHRTDDIAGELIPQVYFDFIRKKNASQYKRLVKSSLLKAGGKQWNRHHQIIVLSCKTAPPSFHDACETGGYSGIGVEL